MKNLLLVVLCILVSLLACQENKSKLNRSEPINEQLYLELGGAEQYVEIISQSSEKPVLLFIHGGPAWPQTPQLRYLNSDLAKSYTLVIWEQRAAGKSYMRNPDPENISLQQIVQDGHELTLWLKKKFAQQKIYLAGYSWGSLVGVQLADKFPNDYMAYIGIAQLVHMDRGMEISRDWLSKQIQAAHDHASMKRLDSLKNPSFYPSKLDRFFNQWILLNQYHGAVYNEDAEAVVQKAMHHYDDYNDYEWFSVWENSSRKLESDMYGADVREISQLSMPVFLIEGRHDWNIPAVLAEQWLEDLTAPKKKLYWFEKSGHGPLEEEAEKFNNVMRIIVENEMTTN